MLHTATGARTGTNPRVPGTAAPVVEEGTVSVVAESRMDAPSVANPRRVRI